MDWSDLAESLKGAKHVTINIVENGEMFTGPVQVNQAAEPEPAVDNAPAVDHAPRCQYCGWDTDPLIRYGARYYHARCKSEEDHKFSRMASEIDPDPVPAYVVPWQVVRSEPIQPDPELAIQIAVSQEKTIFEEIAERYDDRYNELAMNGVRHAEKEQQWIDSINQRQFAHREAQ